jgi:hypothetical protein
MWHSYLVILLLELVTNTNPLIYFDKKLNGDDYRKIISNEIKPSLYKEYGWSDQTGKPFYKFCQDEDSTHTAKETKELLEIFQIPLCYHPAWSPDMNPI